MRVRFSGSGHLYSAIAPASSLGSLGSLRHRSLDAHIGSAAAEIAAEPLLNLGGCRVGIAIKECLASHDEARCAEAALLGVVVYEGLLHRVQLPVLLETLD